MCIYVLLILSVNNCNKSELNGFRKLSSLIFFPQENRKKFLSIKLCYLQLIFFWKKVLVWFVGFGFFFPHVKAGICQQTYSLSPRSGETLAGHPATRHRWRAKASTSPQPGFPMAAPPMSAVTSSFFGLVHRFFEIFLV